jgi:AAA15 family ATPase/GTPase
MIEKVSIQNFKSIRNLEFDSRRVNIFIGEPNSGKSNLLEALGLFSLGYVDNLDEIVRSQQLVNLFFDNDVTNLPEIKIYPVSKGEILIDGKKSSLKEVYKLSFSYESERLLFSLQEKYLEQIEWRSRATTSSRKDKTLFPPGANFFLEIKYYKFLPSFSFKETYHDFLLPSIGKNLFSLLLTNKSFRNNVSDIFKSKGFRLNLDTRLNEINMIKEIDDVFYTYPYVTVSDTLQRIVFYIAAIKTNKNSTLIFEEPEANTFPFYTKQLAEMIGLDESNQYFIATHNPYFLGSIVEKTPLKDLSVFITYMEKYETKLRQLTEAEIPEILDTDIFYNLHQYLPDESQS